MNYFSEQLKKLRIQKGYTMQVLADEADVSKSMISKIECQDVQPTLDVAARLAKALGTTLSEMLHTPQATQVIYLMKKDQAVWEDTQQHIKRRNISPVFEGLKLEWLHIELPVKASINSMPAMAKGVEKYVVIIKGTITARINEKTFQLKKGDSLYFDASSLHEFTNTGREKAEYYMVIKHV